MKKKILLDIDEVFCFSGYLELVNEFLNTNYIIDDFTEYYIDEAAISKDRKQEFYQFISTKDQYENPVLLPGYDYHTGWQEVAKILLDKKILEEKESVNDANN